MTRVDEVVLATHNAKKLAELRRIVEASGLEMTVHGLTDVADYPDPAETETTFEGNALIKARAAVQATGMAALADDSGLEVDALNGMPGVRTARWSGPQATDESNRRLVLAQVDDVPDERRGARFVCAMALVLPDGTEHTLRAAMEGHLAHAESGTNGFGYDPIFIAEGREVTNGHLSPQEKDAISHRGKAVRAMVDHLRSLNDPREENR
ncbi:RdgB/HAM1 family non-canonical purine NTP pyrophosphatase [Nigerium massiliense]|uniref:RdgB/HAM1 family non-canonical purine NTP pyrophosphatase n=1 Tax=Nigerium massiliense TaxID=1522317 RepID=UPI00058DAEF2|nr:RdgB/HAM1 family non-canonical purine NTP pyrophosphatase [Nigerium massiliense]